MLSYTRFGDPAAVSWIAIAHGILGSGKNWRSFARQLCDRSGWGAVAIDLRMHGGSQDRAGPHTIETAAGDVVELAGALARDGIAISALCGHSFGGKVLTAARPAIPSIDHTWLIDSSPSPRPGAMESDNDAVLALRALEQVTSSLGDRFAARGDFTAALEARGLSAPVAAWLALNLERDGGELVLRLDLAAIRSLVADYFATDTWAELESGGVVDVAIAGRGSALDAADQQRVADLERRGYAQLHRFEDSGHWIHVDARAALVAAMATGLSA